MTKYTDLIPSANSQQPDFFAMLALVTGAWVDNQTTLAEFDDAFDLDEAVGAQLDVCGQWIGMSRIIKVPITGLYFSFDIIGLGFDEAVWFQTGNPLFSSVSLLDAPYRAALKAKALANRIGRSIYNIYAILDIFFTGTPNQVIVHNYQNMSFAIEVIGPPIDINTRAILDGDYLQLRPTGVALLPTLPLLP